MSRPDSLINLLSVSIVLRNIVLYLPFSSLCRLSQTCKAIRENLRSSPDAYKYVDVSNTLLSNCCPTIWNTIDCGRSRHLNCDCIDNGKAHDDMEKISDDDLNDTRWLTSSMKEPQSREAFCSRPARSILIHLGRAGILQHVQVLILDNALITAEFIMDDILISIDVGRLTVRLLSIREARLTNESKLAAMLKDYALTNEAALGVSNKFPKRQRKEDGSSRGIIGLYIFRKPVTVNEVRMTKHQETGFELSSRRNSRNGLHGKELDLSRAKHTDDDGNLWYEQSGFLIHDTIAPCWADTLKACADAAGSLAFDAVICRGPRHDRDAISNDRRLHGLKYLPPEVATAALGPNGCRNCGSAPEGFARWHSQGTPGPDIPLLSPLPKTVISVREAKRPLRLQKHHHHHHQQKHVRADREEKRTIMRCRSCLTRRHCSTCNSWWCEFCYNPAASGLTFSAGFILENIMAGMDTAAEARALTADAAFEIALERYIGEAKFVISQDYEKYWCVERCLKEEVFRPCFDHS